MILSISELSFRLGGSEYLGQRRLDNATSELELEAIESVIRAYTHNNFQNRNVRFVASSEETKLCFTPSFLRPGDTVQISQSKVNDGVYTIKSIEEDGIILDMSYASEHLFNVPYNLVTKVEYPEDVKQCAADLYKWKLNMGGKVGIKSETLSRHSVTYEDSATLFMGYPVGILNGLNLHKKARCGR